MEITSIFSVPICQSQYEDDLGDLKEECIRRSTLDSGRTATSSGWQSNNIFSDDDFFSDFILEIEEQANNFAKELEICQRVKLSNLWININGYKDFNRRHTHQNSILSGVFYVKVPDKFSKLRFYHPAFHLMVRDWDVDLKYNQHTSDIWNIIPEEGKLVLFPSWLEHEVDPNSSQEKRISISFNFIGES